MTIKDVARRTGFSAPTLRYYEQIGLLPESTRTPAGYRTYDESTVGRLSFIARAKQLGCTLDEIADLTTAWEGGRCGPIQDHLRTLVAEKLSAARAKVVELTTLSAELARAATALEQHRPEGACDDRCGCLSGPEPLVQQIAITSKPATGDVPIACSLQPDALREQVDDWQRLLAHATDRMSTERGIRLQMSPETPIDELARLVAAERGCCQFLQFAITLDTRGIGLEVDAPDDARSIVEALFGASA